jgi:predicted amidohydrolase
MHSGPDLVANLARARTLVHEAADRGAALVALPEVFAWRGPKADEPTVASPIPGVVSEFLCSLAAEAGVILVGGSFLERTSEPARSANTSLLIDAAGVIRAAYRKVHLFDVDLPGQVTVCESQGRVRGTEAVTAETPVGTVGMSICYDLRFPELYRRLASAGATIIAVPSAFTAFTGAAHWEPLLRARAIENQAYVIAPNQTGTSPNGYADYGNSMIVDPWGVVVARAGDGDGIITAEIDPARVAQVRREMPCLSHARFLT